jgi:LysR family hydrogen peroxide-inducible transcriptional activator
MELDQLRYFVAVAHAGNFTRAAEQEGVTQPALSQQVQKLEVSLGVQLFERRGRSVRLTRAGERLLPQARSLLRQAADAKQSVVEATNQISGRLTVGAIPTVMPYWLAPHVASFRSGCLDVELNIVENLTARLLEGLQTGDLDVAIISLPITVPDIICSELFREELLFVLPNNHPLGALPRIDPRRIAGEHLLVLREGHCFRKDALAACRRGVREPDTVFESDQFSSIFASGCPWIWNYRSPSNGSPTRQRLPLCPYHRRPIPPHRLRANTPSACSSGSKSIYQLVARALPPVP